MSTLSSAVVHLTMCFGETHLSTGSGVFYKKDDKYYIVTAWHNATGRNTETLDFLDIQYSSVPDNMIVTFKAHANGMITSMSVTIPLYGENKALFFVHPNNWPRIDVIAIPFDPFIQHTLVGYIGGKRVNFPISLTDNDGKCMIRSIQEYLAPKELTEKWLKGVDVTEEVFIPSYPHNITDIYFNPVWKRATIASDPKVRWNNERKYLIDSASSSGMSGASVFYYNTEGVVYIGSGRHHTICPAVIHAGVYVGRIGVKEKADPQVGTVWHVSVIDEIIDGKNFDFLSYDIEVKDQVIEEAIRNKLKTLSAEGLSNVLNEETPARHYLHREVLNEIKGRAKPEKLFELIVVVASTYDGPLVESEE